jgi:hypothetical protein
MDEGKILLVRIPQGSLGEDVSSLLVTKLQLAAHSRVDLPPERRRAFYLYVDEFQNFATSSTERILTEARGFGLGLVCANQYPEQLSRDVQLAITRNAATSVQASRDQGRYRLQVTRLEDARRERPARILTACPPVGPGDPERAARIRAASRLHYGRQREEVEAEIRRKLQGMPGPAGTAQTNGKVLATVGPRVDIDEE